MFLISQWRACPLLDGRAPTRTEQDSTELAALFVSPGGAARPPPPLLPSLPAPPPPPSAPFPGSVFQRSILLLCLPLLSLCLFTAVLSPLSLLFRYFLLPICHLHVLPFPLSQNGSFNTVGGQLRRTLLPN